MPKKNMNNAQLDSCIRRLAQGDRDSFHTLYNISKDSVFLFALSIVKNYYTAEDVLQESMLHIAASAKNYKPNTNPKAWIFSITRNICLDVLKSASRKDIPLDEVQDSIQVNDNAYLALEATKDVMEALQVLSQQEREIISLYIFAGLRQTEIANTIQIPYVRVRSQYRYALKKLRIYYEQKEGFLYD